jgi:hypothetical protein
MTLISSGTLPAEIFLNGVFVSPYELGRDST